MKSRLKPFLFIFSCLIGFSNVLIAAPSLPVTKPPATPNPSYTGPIKDAQSAMGQWFINLTNSVLEYRTHEFYDNSLSSGGGLMGHLAISGQVANIAYVAEPFVMDIVSFEIVATVYNDAISTTGPWDSGTNSLLENLNTTSHYTNSLQRAILTVNFAAAGLIPSNMGTPPYRTAAPYITATDHDYLAWYGNASLAEYSSYYVPGWDFGTIPAGEARTRTLHFVIRTSGGFPSQLETGTSRYQSIIAGKETDIFINRSRSLKINQWISDPLVDDATAYPTNSLGEDAGNVSLFHNILAETNQAITIKSIQYRLTPPSVLLMSMGTSNGITPQIIQYCTNLMTTNWISVVTNIAFPAPETNSWIHSNFTGSAQFYRIVEP